MKKLILSAMLLMTAAVAAAQPPQGMRNSVDRPCLSGAPQNCYRTSGAVPQANIDLAAITQAEIDSLRYMREEEKLAHDVYSYLYQQWQLPIFANIAEAELQHTQTMLFLLERYQQPDPAANLAAGQFRDPTLQKLYNQLIAEGSQSLQQALLVGAKIEELDIYDLQKAQTEAKQPDILFAYQNLERGSRNHLRSFNRMLQRSGVQYKPQYISNQAFQQIIAGVNERGR